MSRASSESAAAILPITYCIKAWGSMPLALAVPISENMAALVLAPSGVSLNDHAFLPTAKGLMSFSAKTLLIRSDRARNNAPDDPTD